VPVGADREAAQAAAMADPRVQRFVGGEDVAQVIVVPGRLVNLVTRRRPEQKP